MVIQHNITALRAYNDWNFHNNRVSKALGRLSSGYRINSAADDPAGLAVSERMKAQLAMLKREKLNAMDAMSSIQISEGVQGEIGDMLQRMNELATQAMNGTLDDSDREKLDAEYQQLMDEIDRVTSGDKKNTVSLFGKMPDIEDGADDIGEAVEIRGANLDAYLDALDTLLMDISQAAANGDHEKLLSLGIDESLATDQEKVQKAVLDFTKQNAEKLLNTPGTENAKQTASIVLTGGNIQIQMLYSDTKDLGLRDTNLLDISSAGQALEAVKNASGIVTRQRSLFGACTNRLEHTINLINTMEENMEEALSRILDADMAKEMMTFVREKALAQCSMFVMTYASHEPEQVLQLLKTM